MASARISHTFADGSSTTAKVTLEASYPDSVAEARAAVVALWREAVPHVAPEDAE